MFIYLILPLHLAVPDLQIAIHQSLSVTFSLSPSLPPHPPNTHTHIQARRQTLDTVINPTNAESRPKHHYSTSLAPTSLLHAHTHISSDVITISAEIAAQRYETSKSNCLPSIIKSFTRIGQLTLSALSSIPFYFNQSCCLCCKRPKDCQMILACFHHTHFE